MNGHLFGAGDSGAAALRRQRQQDARRRNQQRADADRWSGKDNGQQQKAR